MSNLDGLGDLLDQNIPSKKQQKPSRKRKQPPKPPEQAQPARGKGGHIAAEGYTKRLTLDLRPSVDKQLALWVLQNDSSSKADVLRWLVDEFLQDSQLQTGFLTSIYMDSDDSA